MKNFSLILVLLLALSGYLSAAQVFGVTLAGTETGMADMPDCPEHAKGAAGMTPVKCFVCCTPGLASIPAGFVVPVVSHGEQTAAFIPPARHEGRPFRLFRPPIAAA